MRICVVGLGYMGLPTALFLARAGCTVTGYDIVEEKVRSLGEGKLPFSEEGLDELFAAGKTRFTPTTSTASFPDQDVFIIAVPTPSKDGKCDLSYVESAVRTIAPLRKKESIVILESTVRPGTVRDVVAPMLGEYNPVLAAAVPEKAIPGKTLHEMVHNARIIGGIDEESTRIAHDVYALFVKGQIHLTDATTAETVKLVENTYRDVNIALANELAQICEKLGMNVWEVRELANLHPRVDVHLPGPGVGGHCISVDPWFLIEDSSSTLIEQARRINDAVPSYVVERMRSLLEDVQDPTIAILGVAYKKDVDDARNSPAQEIISLAQKEGWTVRATDPYVRQFSIPLLPVDDALSGADLVVIVTDHSVYADLDLSSYDVLDTRNTGKRGKTYSLLGDAHG